MKIIHLSLILALIFSSCSNRLYTGNGAFHNASFTTDQYEIEELNITKSGSSFFGIPINQSKNNTSGFTFSFNGINISKVPQFFPILTFAALTWQSANIMTEIGVGSKVYDSYVYDTFTGTFVLDQNGSFTRSPNILSYVLGLPISATFNSLIWKGASKGAAGSEINTEMLEQNPDVDMFLFPKYSIQTEGFYKESSTVKLRVKAATLKE